MNKKVRRWFRRHPQNAHVFVPSGEAPVRHSWRTENPGEGGATWWQQGTVFARDGRSWADSQPCRGAGHKLVAVNGGWESVPANWERAGLRPPMQTEGIRRDTLRMCQGLHVLSRDLAVALRHVAAVLKA